MNPGLLGGLLYLWTRPVTKTKAKDLSCQVMPGAFNLFEKLIQFFFGQIVFGFADNPNRHLWPGRIGSLTENVDLFRLCVPCLPRSFQHTGLPSEFALQHIVQHDIGNIFNIAAKMIIQGANLFSYLVISNKNMLSCRAKPGKFLIYVETLFQPGPKCNFGVQVTQAYSSSATRNPNHLVVITKTPSQSCGGG